MGDVKIHEVLDECDSVLSLHLGDFYNTSVMWSNGVVGNRIDNVMEGFYTVTLIAENGCEVTKSINIE